MATRWFARRLAALADRRSAMPFSSLSSSSTSTSISMAPASSFSMPSSMTPKLCGRGDRKTKSGKRFRGTYGKARPKKDKKIERIKEKVEVPQSTPWPLPFKLI